MSAFLYFSIILLSPHAKVLQQICDYSGHPYAVQHGYYELRRNSGNAAHIFWFRKAQTSPASAHPVSPHLGPGRTTSLRETSEQWRNTHGTDHIGVFNLRSCVWKGTRSAVVPSGEPSLGVPFPRSCLNCIPKSSALQAQPFGCALWVQPRGATAIKCSK